MINILAHSLTPAQLAELGGEPTHIKAIDAALAAKIANCPADSAELEAMAASLCRLAIGIDGPGFGSQVLAGSGSPAFTAILGREAARTGVLLVFAHSERVSTDAVQPDGSVRKVSEFRHVKFFEV